MAEVPADLAIIEVGLGGSLDATNVIDRPLLSVIAPVDYDHAEFLGTRIEGIAGEKAGTLLAVALTLEVLFLALTLTNDLTSRYRKMKAIGLTCALALLVPIGALVVQPVALLSPVWITGFLSFGLMALLYLVTEELLVEAHEKPDSPLISAMFFVGFLALLLIEEIAM